MSGKIELRARLAGEGEAPGFDVTVEVSAPGMPDAAKADIARKLAEHTVDVVAALARRC